MPIRLCILTTDLKTGGVPMDVYRLATALGPDDFAVRVGCLAGRGAMSDRLETAGVETFACGAGGAWDLRALLRLRRELRAFRPDVLHAFLFHANAAACVVGPLAGVPPRRIITEILTVETERRWHLILGGLLCRMCRVVVGNSRPVVEHLHRAGHVPASRLACVPGGVDADRFVEAEAVDPATLGVPEGHALLMWVGRLDPVKGLDELVDAMGMLREQSVTLGLVGEGAYEDEIRRRVDRHGLGGRVCFFGRRDDVPNLLAAADVFVFPSRTEGMPNALLEAMAAGSPIVTTDVPGCRDVVTDGRTGLLVPARRPEALAGAIERLLADRELAARLGSSARRRAVAEFDFARTVERYAALYREVTAGTRE